MVVNALSRVSGVNPVRFVGRALAIRIKGSRKQQVEILERFRAGNIMPW